MDSNLIEVESSLNKSRQSNYTRKNIFLAIIILLVIFAVQFLVLIKNNTYVGYIKLMPKSLRSKEYLAFELENKPVKKNYMILVKDLEFNKKLENYVNKRVQVSGKLFLHEPKDFDKIEIYDVELFN